MARLEAPDAATEKADIQHLMAQPQFRRFMLRLHARAGIMVSTYRADAAASAWSEGRRNLGLELLDKIEGTAPGALVAILTEPVSKPQGAPRERNDPRSVLDTDTDTDDA